MKSYLIMKRYSLPFFLLFTFLLNAQHQDKVDFIRAEVFVELIPETKEIKGFVTYEFDILQDVDSIFLDAKNMEFERINLDASKIKYNYDGKRIAINKEFKRGSSHRLVLKYSCSPKQTVYFLGWGDGIKENEQIWTQGQGKYTSHWLPSFDAMEEKVEFDLNFNGYMDGKIPITNGNLKEVVSNHIDGQIISYDMQKPMSSYLLAFAIGNYKKQELKSKSGISIENYYYPQDSLKVEPTYRYTKEIFDFLEEEIGVPYPWQNYKQIPVRDFLYAGMENTTATIFSDGYVVDSTAFVDKNYINVNAHELAHQWFGNLVTEKNGNHHWLHEGFATYYAYLAEKEIFGDDHFYWKLFETLKQLKSEVTNENGQSLLDPKASSLTFYEKGAWALFMLQNEVGEEAFKAGIKSYLNKYQFQNVTVQDFLKAMEVASSSDLSNFREKWLERDRFPYENAKNLLAKKSLSVKLAFELDADLITFQKNAVNYKRYWNATKSIQFKKYLMNTSSKYLPKDIYNEAFAMEAVPVRQQLARRLDSIPAFLKTDFESLLNDKSYVTVENALFKLWVTYPEEKAKYLAQTKDIIGFPNKNVRLLWLTLAILTNDYEANNTQAYFQELSGYTSPRYGWETRLGAFQYLNEIGFTNESLHNLIDATVHHSWQFKKYARNLMDKLLEDPDYKIRISEISKELKDEELRYMNTKLGKE
mgnify:CR=1 FL=1